MGVYLSDIEHPEGGKNKPLDKIRNLPLGWKILVNTILLTIFVIYGSWKGYGSCYTDHDSECPLWYYASACGWIFGNVGYYAASISLILLSLTSDVAQWILSTWAMQFLGRISFPLYLIHNLIIEWPETTMFEYLLANGNQEDENLYVLYVFLTWTPILIVISWLLEILVDTPAKNFAY